MGQNETPAPADFAGRTGAAMVVGANGGIGAATARMLAARGATLALTYRRDPGPVDRVLANARGRAYRLDLTDADACARVITAAAAELGGLHTLIYAAGPRVPMMHLSRVEPARMRAQLVDDAAAFFNVMHAALPSLRERGGSVVAVTTAATHRFAVRDGLSSAPKGAVEAMARALAAEEGRFGIRVNCVGPGMLTNGMAEDLIDSGELDERALEAAHARTPLRRFGVAADIAEAVCFLASDRASFVSGQKLDVDGGYGV
jgi:3-oxoacyl-[acyl-carrier protein] reductase